MFVFVIGNNVYKNGYFESLRQKAEENVSHLLFVLLNRY